MLDPLLVLTLISLVACAVLAYFVGTRSVSAYNLTGRAHLVNLSAGFFCLGLSYVGSIAIIFTLYYPFGSNVIQNILSTSDLIPRLLLELLGYALIASAYFSRDRAGSYALLILIMAASVGAIVSTAFLSVFQDLTWIGSIHLLEATLAIYTLFQMGRSYTTRIVKNSIIVSWGFGMLAVSQYTWLIWSYDNFLLTAAFAVVFRVVGLAILVHVLRK